MLFFLHIAEKLSLIQPECVQERSKMLHTRDNSFPGSSTGGPASYETPALPDLQRLIWFRGGSDNHVDQVWPNIYLGDAWAARSITTIQSLNITHILNAADGPYSINTGAKYYKDLQIEYFGIEAFDDPSFDLSIFFYDAANFIGKALNTSGGKVFVHCAMGVSRSATLVLAFLMIHENMTLVDALKTDGLGLTVWQGSAASHNKKSIKHRAGRAEGGHPIPGGAAAPALDTCTPHRACG
uniref:Protein-serine/threonine phosphatase n=1 Tax=Pavo cristatus TaxID=9049 RepID=A0A8C9F531_PAVCR